MLRHRALSIKPSEIVLVLIPIKILVLPYILEFLLPETYLRNLIFFKFPTTPRLPSCPECKPRGHTITAEPTNAMWHGSGMKYSTEVFYKTQTIIREQSPDQITALWQSVGFNCFAWNLESGAWNLELGTWNLEQQYTKGSFVVFLCLSLYPSVSICVSLTCGSQREHRYK